MPEFKFSYSGDKEVFSIFEQMKKKSQEISSQAIQDAASYSNNVKDQIKNAEQLLNLQKKKIQQEREFKELSIRSETSNEIAYAQKVVHSSKLQLGELEKLRSSGKIGGKEYKERKTELKREHDEAKLFIDSAPRELAEFLKVIKENTNNDQLLIKAALEELGELKRIGEILGSLKKQDKEAAEELLSSIEDPKKAKGAEALGNELREEQKRREVGNKANTFFDDLLKFKWLGKVTDTISSMPNAQSGFDLVRPVGKQLGGLVSGLGSTITDGILDLVLENEGTQAKLKKWLGLAGKAGADALGGLTEAGIEAIMRNEEERTGYLRSALGYRSLTGNMGIYNTGSSYGVDPTTIAATSVEVAKAFSNRRDIGFRTESLLTHEKGFGIDRGLLTDIIRINRTQNNVELGQTIGTVLELGKNSVFGGGDRTFLNEFLGQFTSLKREMMKTTDKVSDAAVASNMLALNSIGGQFALKDERSQGLISNIHNSLVNPGSDSVRALAFSALRRRNPELSSLQMEMEMEKGLGSESYMSSVLEMLKQYGGGSENMIRNIKGVFGLPSLSSASQIYDNMDDLISGKIRYEDLPGVDSSSQARSEAEMSTTRIDSWTAGVKESFLKGSMDGVLEVGKQFFEYIREGLNNAQFTFELRATGSKDGVIIVNNVKTPQKQKAGGGILQKVTELLPGH